MHLTDAGGPAGGGLKEGTLWGLEKTAKSPLRLELSDRADRVGEDIRELTDRGVREEILEGLVGPGKRL